MVYVYTMQASVMLIRRENLVLAVARKTDYHDLGLPGGRTEDGESPEETAIRETFEETGVTVSRCHFLGHREDGLFEVHVFEADEWSGVPISTETPVAWVHFQRLIEPTNTFADFNRELFRRLGFMD